MSTCHNCKKTNQEVIDIQEFIHNIAIKYVCYDCIKKIVSKFKRCCECYMESERNYRINNDIYCEDCAINGIKKFEIKNKNIIEINY